MSSGGDCFTPVAALSADVDGPVARAVEAHRSARFDALLQLIGEIQRRRTIDEVAAVVAGRWKHCASVTHWRLVCVYGTQAALVAARGARVEVRELSFAALEPHDALQWQRCLPQEMAGDALTALRDALPSELAGRAGVHLTVLPLMQGTQCIAILNALSSAVPDLLDRKFIAQVGAAMSARVFAILTERTLTAELLRAERRLAEQHHAAMLGRIVGGVAHELNTPLAVQISACGTLLPVLESGGDEELREIVTLVDAQAHRAAAIVRRLKQVSAASQAAPAQPTPLVQALGQIAAAQAMHADGPAIDVDGPDDASCVLDANALGCVIGELLDNARLHGARRVQVRVSAAPADAGESGWCVEVHDDGPGMPPEVAARLFEPFFTTGRSRGLLGLGGYIVQNLARDALGAAVEVDRLEAAGTSVRLRLPT